MISFKAFLFIYFTGGITFLPLLALAVYIYVKRDIPSLFPKRKYSPEIVLSKDPEHVIIKKGWIRLTNQYQPKMPEINTTNVTSVISGIHSFVSGNSSNPNLAGEKNHIKQTKGVMYAVLKCGTLFCYESEKHQEPLMILPLHDYEVSLYPPTRKDQPEGEFYGRRSVIRLVPNVLSSMIKDDATKKISNNVPLLDEENITCKPTRVLYLTCSRGIDKEDWYLGLLDAHHMLLNNGDSSEEAQFVMMDNTHFSPSAMKELIRQVQSSPSHRETAWINAILGRIFLGMYKADRLQKFVEAKIKRKIEKTKRPTFLDEITVRKVDVGQSVPFLTDPKLLSLSPEGEIMIEANVEYQGGLTIEIETDFNWSYSSRMKPIRMNLILAVKLKKMAGKLMFKIKPPPTNRYWISFFEMPEMEWKITPVVADKTIKLSIITNAIESRIREVMAETFVLPNMDDTSFCPSDGMGGIFGDYIKVEKKPRRSEEDYLSDSNSSKRMRGREGSVASSNSTNGSQKGEKPIIKEPPSVPNRTEKADASDVLKLKTRRAESASDFVTSNNNTLGLSSFNLEMSRSTPTIQATSTSSTSGSASEDDDRGSFTESVTSTHSKWSAKEYLRNLKANSERSEGLHNDTDSISSFKSPNKLLSKFSSILPTKNPISSSDSASIHSGEHRSNNSQGKNEKNAFMKKAGNFIAKKMNGAKNDHDEDTCSPISEEKKKMYAERVAEMRKRSEENSIKHESSSSNTDVTPVYKDLPSEPPTNDSILDNEDQTSVESGLLQLPIKPQRTRAASSAVEASSPTQKPPLPLRRISSPSVYTQNKYMPPNPEPKEVKEPDIASTTSTTTTLLADVDPVLPSDPTPTPSVPDKTMPMIPNKDTLQPQPKPPLPTAPRPKINEKKLNPTDASENRDLPKLPPRTDVEHITPPAIPPRAKSPSLLVAERQKPSDNNNELTFHQQ